MPLASALAGGPTAFVRADVALDGEPIVGSFTVDGMTFAVMEGSDVELVGVSPDWQQAMSSQEGDGSPVAPMLASEPDGASLAVPESVAFEGVDYTVSSIGAYAFYLSGVTSASLPASVVSVDERAFRSSDVASVEVDPDNLSYASFDGILYDASLSRLLLIPGGRTGAARISDKAEEVDAQAFSHCAGVTSISVDAGSASLSSWDGLLYDASGATLLRVPAGATDITIRDGCTTIAAGALEGCAQLTSITAPASVISISPDVFTSVPTVSLPAALAVADDPGASTGATEELSEQAGSTPVSGSTGAQQLSALVALTSTDDDLPEVDPSAITVSLPEGADERTWAAGGFRVERATSLPSADDGEDEAPVTTLDSAGTYSGRAITFDPNGGILYTNSVTVSTGAEKVSSSTVPGVSTSWDAFAQVATADGSLRVETNAGNPLRATYVYTYATYNGIKAVAMGASKDGPEMTWEEMRNDNGSYYYFLYPTVKITLDQQGGEGGTTAVTARVANYVPTCTMPTRAGYTFQGYYSAPNGGGNKYYNSAGASYRILDTTSVTTLYAYWTKNAIQTVNIRLNAGDTTTIYKTIYLWYGKGWYSISNPTESTAQLTTIGTPTRTGYTFVGTNTSSTSTTNGYSMQSASTFPSVTYYGSAAASGSYNRYVIWAPVVAADVPLEVTATVDLFDAEGQVPARGYIESRSGGTLQVAQVDFTPLAGAADLFGTRTADVALEALAGGEANASVRFALDGAASESDASALSSFLLPTGYGSRLAVAYRFAIPQDVLAAIDPVRFEQVTTPVCAVAYTVALA